jgi:toxin YoeB
MAKKLIWSKQALQDRKDILDYWINRNKSKTYSIRLNNLFIDAIKIIAEHPNIGIATQPLKASSPATLNRININDNT